VRIRWWVSDAKTLRDATFLPKELRGRLPDLLVPPHAKVAFPTDKPIFFGHYWFEGLPRLRCDKLACLDYSAANGGPLVAYRWDGEANLSEKNFVSTD
jgi:hypothetical protein